MEILIALGMVWPVSSDKWKVPLHSFSPLSLSFPVLSESTLLLLPAVPGDWGYSEVTSSASGTL